MKTSNLIVLSFLMLATFFVPGATRAQDAKLVADAKTAHNVMPS